jgi:hypothetical protein
MCYLRVLLTVGAVTAASAQTDDLEQCITDKREALVRTLPELTSRNLRSDVTRDEAEEALQKTLDAIDKDCERLACKKDVRQCR